jgi:hypothetical protein
MADLSLQNSQEKTWGELSLSFGMPTGTVKTPDFAGATIGGQPLFHDLSPEYHRWMLSVQNAGRLVTISAPVR